MLIPTVPDVFLDHGHLNGVQAPGSRLIGDQPTLRDRHGGHEEERGGDEIQTSHGGGRLGLKSLGTSGMMCLEGKIMVIEG